MYVQAKATYVTSQLRMIKSYVDTSEIYMTFYIKHPHGSFGLFT